MLGVGASEKTYLDDVFSNYLYTGDGASTRTITNGIDLSGEGGLTWIKHRESTQDHILVDTVRGAGKKMQTNKNNAEATDGTSLKSFTSTGFTVGSHNEVNESTKDFTSWSFRKSPGFLDIVEFSGNGSSSQVISHNLGSVPGMIILKAKNVADDWKVYHRGLNGGVNPEKWLVKLTTDQASSEYTEWWNDTAPTATNFTVGEWNNASGWDFVAYVFAGGESTATGAASVQYNGNDYNYFNDHADFDVGTNFTAECWFKANSIPSGTNYNVIMGQWFNSNAWVFEYVGTTLRFYYGSSSNYKNLGTTSNRAGLNQWHHLAFSKQGTTTRIFLDGVQVVEDFDMGTQSSSSSFKIGGHASGSGTTDGCFDGWISNVRVVKDTAVYTSSFRVPTEPLTGITNTVILCNNDPTNDRGTTVNTTGDYNYGGTTYSDPSPKTDSPFDDPAAFTFGDSKEGIVKCGSYKASSSADTTINLGWEPQFIMIKCSDQGTTNWSMYDSMRGIPTSANESYLYPNLDASEYSAERLSLTPTGFIVDSSGGVLTSDNDNTYMYLAIRRPDGYVGKPRTATELFAMAYGNSGGTNPSFISNFPVDFALNRQPTTTEAWYTVARLMEGRYLYANGNDAEQSASNFVFDYSNGWRDGSAVTTYLNHMWRRSNSFDTIVYKGDGVAGREIRHSMNKIPEMMWIKRMDSSANWTVYHKGLNSGSSPENYYIVLNGSDNQVQHTTRWNNTAPTSTHFTVGTSSWVNQNGGEYLAILFSSETGISKCGYYDGSNSSQTITTGFQPRFVLFKEYYNTQQRSWLMLDTTRGWASGNDKGILLSSSNAQFDFDYSEPTSTGFTLAGGLALTNDPNNKYIYYAHA